MPTKYTTVSFQKTATGNVVTSISGESIYVVGYVLSSCANAFVNWQDEDGTQLTGQMSIGVNTLPMTYAGTRDAYAFKVTKNKSLAIATNVATTVSGHVQYYSL